jgi:NADPH-dependent 2,4-dienoyl-CoA reductase/sulfur reductase-like enzyme
MNARRLMTRRSLVRGIATATVASRLPTPSIAQSRARIAVIGGGFGGASCARELRRIAPELTVTLVEPNRTFTACPFSNQVIAGLRDLKDQQFDYASLIAEGITLIAEPAVSVDPRQRLVGFADGHSIGYERLVLAPGIALKFDALPGYDEAAAAILPHAWKAGPQTLLLRRQLEAMEDGGVVALALPPGPSRCPPAQYERASLIAHYLKSRKPRSKILILDAKDAFPQQRLFEAAWQDLYPGMIERIGLSQGGRVTAVDANSRTLITDFGNYTADVANIIPPQQAGRIAALAGTVDQTGWCPIDPISFASKLVPDLHVIGDSCFGGVMPKSASAANAQAKACASAVVQLIAGEPPAIPRLTSTCYSTVAPDYAFSLTGIYQPQGQLGGQPQDGLFAEVEGGHSSAVDAPRAMRASEADQAQAWFTTITVDSFG